MDTPNLNGRKRKKRKTRKCLDELRKRSRTTKLIENTNEIQSHIPGNTTTNLKPNSITMDRLTLAMFPNAIRSETITRPALIEISNEPLNIENIVKGRKETITTRSALVHISNESSNMNIASGRKDTSSTLIESNVEIQAEVSSINNFKRNIEITCTALSNGHDDDSPNSLNMFSPRSNRAETDIFESSDPEGINLQSDSSSTTTQQSQSSQTTSFYNLHNGLMHRLSQYMLENMSTMLSEDVMEKDINLLKKLYIDSCHMETDENIQVCILKTPEENNNQIKQSDLRIQESSATIVENPMDYLRLGYAWHQSSSREVDGYLMSNSSSESSLSPSQSLVQYSPPAHSLVPNSPPPHVTAQSLVQDTPEYIYYPHKLNQ